MSSIVLISATADHDRVGCIIDAFVEHDSDVFWHQVHKLDESISTDLKTLIGNARCVILILSRSSLQGESVFYSIADLILTESKALFVKMDEVRLPVTLAKATTYDMRDWRCQPNRWRRWFGGSLFMRELISASRSKIAGRHPAPPNAPRDMLIRQMLTLIPALGAVILTTASFLGAISTFGGLSRFFLFPKEKAAWENIEDGSCLAYERFKHDFKNRYYFKQVEKILASKKLEQTLVQETIVSSEPFYAGYTSKLIVSEGLARQENKQRITENARKWCNDKHYSNQYQVVSQKLIGIEYQDATCFFDPASYKCKQHATATCETTYNLPIIVEKCYR